MKGRVLKLVILLLLVFGASGLRAQPWYGDIDSLKLLPASPASNDTLKVVCYATFPTSACFLLSSSISIIDTVITVNAIHLNGGYAAICHSVDTFTIGSNFSPGSYSLIYTLADSMPIIDSMPVIVDVDTLFFTLPVSTAIGDRPNSLLYEIFPNPVSDFITIDFSGLYYLSSFLTIRNIFGQYIFEDAHYKLENNHINRIDLSQFTPGIYFLEMTINGKRFFRKIMKN